MTTLNKCIWLVNALQKAGARGLSLKELSQKWERSECGQGEHLARSSFDRYKGYIQDLLGLYIECNLRGGYRYYIGNPKALERNELSRWLLDTYTTANTLAQNAAIKDRILVEQVPSSQVFLTEILDAMQENRAIKITYKGFQSRRSHSFPVEPYCVKMHQRRWYLLAYSVHDKKLRIYALDRIEEIQPTEQLFDMPTDFNADSYFAEYFGVVCDRDVAVQRIVIRANKYHQHYLRTLPLHSSQRQLFACDDYADFELTLRPTYDFCMELLKAGSMVEVLEPESLRNDMRAWVKDLWKMYK